MPDREAFEYIVNWISRDNILPFFRLVPLAHRVRVMIASLVYHFEWKLPKPEDLDMTESFALTLHRAKQLVAVPKTLN